MSTRVARRSTSWWDSSGLVAVGILGLCALVALGLALVGWPGSSSDAVTPAPPGESSVDAGFARDMQTHHNQAVEMSMLVLDRTRDPQVRTLAGDILLTQQQQVGQMYGWLELWALPQTSTQPAMSWMNGVHTGSIAMPDGARMPGMATSVQLTLLEDSAGRTADRLYLQLLIPHHRGALGMASDAAENAGSPQVRRLAQTMVDSQTAELKVLHQMLADRGGPLPLVPTAR